MGAVENIINRLNVSDPEMNTSLGTPIRKIIDATGAEIEEMSLDNNLLQTRFDISGYSGQNLDDLCSLFGFARQQAKTSFGTVKVTRDIADSSLTISSGSAFFKPATNLTSQITFYSTTDIYVTTGQTVAYVPVVSATTGAINNVVANSITGTQSLSNVTVTNEESFIGGADYEDDASLRLRFKNTIFRNSVGTKDQYLAIASTFDNVSDYKLFGATSHATEYLTVVKHTPVGETDTPYLYVTTQAKDIANTQLSAVFNDGVSGRPCAVWVTRQNDGQTLSRFIDFTTKWLGDGITCIFEDTAVSGESAICYTGIETRLANTNVNADSVKIYAATDVDKVTLKNDKFDNSLFSSGILKRVVADDSNEYVVDYAYNCVSVGDIVIVEYNYTSSKKIIGHGSSLYVIGESVEQVQESRYIDFGLAEKVNHDNAMMWVRNNTDSNPSVGNAVVPLASVPAYSIGSTLSFASGTLVLTEGIDYWLLKDATAYANTIYCVDAIEFNMGGNTKLTTSIKQGITLVYEYDSLVKNMQDTIDTATPIATRCIVCKGTRRYFSIYVDVITRSYNKEQLQDIVSNALAEFFANMTMGDTLQVSDINRVVANIEGIDSCRLAYSSVKNDGGAPYNGGITEVQKDGTVREVFVTDVLMDADEIPMLYAAKVNTLTQEVW